MNSPVITNDTLENLITMMNLTNIPNHEKTQLLNELRDTLIFVENLEHLHAKKVNKSQNITNNVWFEDGSENSRSLSLTQSFHLIEGNLFEVDKIL